MKRISVLHGLTAFTMLAWPAVRAQAQAQAPAQAQAQAGTSVSLLKGRCESLIIADKSATPNCRSELIAILYANRDVSFVLSLADGRMISFKGRAEQFTDAQTTLKVSQVITVRKGAIKASKAAVSGSCVYTRFARLANRLECVAAGRTGRYAASFVTNGTEPARFTLR